MEKVKQEGDGVEYPIRYEMIEKTDVNLQEEIYHFYLNPDIYPRQANGIDAETLFEGMMCAS